jgi:capsular exopolysaccharide synthesis family protein
VAIGEYLRILRRLWYVIVVTLVLGGGVGFATSLVTKPKYESSAQLFVSTQAGTSVGEAYQNNLFSQERVVSYAGLATSEQVAARAVDQLKADISPAELQSKVTAAPVEKTVLLKVSVTDGDARMAQTYANAVADQLVQLVGELETSRRGGTPAAGAVIVDDAGFPSKAIGPTPLVRGLFGAAAGLAGGIVLAVLIGLFDSRLRGRDRVEELTDSLALGALPDDPGRGAVGVIDLAAGGLAVERLRELRTNIQFVRGADGDRPRVISVTSPSREDGRSTTAIDLAAVLAESGNAVVLVDADLRRPTLASTLKLDGEAVQWASKRGLSTVLTGEHDVMEALVEVPGDDRVGSWAVLPAGPIPGAARQWWGSADAEGLLQTLRERFDYVILDTPPLTECTDGAVVAALGDGAIVLARLGHTRSAALRKALKTLQTAHATVLGTVVTGETGHRSELKRDKGSRARRASADVTRDDGHPDDDHVDETVAAAVAGGPAPTRDEVNAGRHATSNNGVPTDSQPGRSR